MNSTHEHFNISALDIGTKLKPHGTHGRVVLMTAPFSDSIVFTVHTRKQRFQKASFSENSGERFRMAPFLVIVFGVQCSVDDSRIRSKTAPFSFENGLVWTGPQCVDTPGYHAFIIVF